MLPRISTFSHGARVPLTAPAGSAGPRVSTPAQSVPAAEETPEAAPWPLHWTLVLTAGASALLWLGLGGLIGWLIAGLGAPPPAT